MSELQTTETPELLGSESAIGEYIESSTRTDGSRTPLWKIARAHELKRAGRSVNAISQILGMDNRTVNAVLARQDHLIADARMLLKANALGFAADAIQASRVAAEKGKIEGISAMLDRLDVTQPPKGQQGSQVAVQINLHGGPEPVSLAKVQVQSESLENQAGKSEGLIMQLMDTAQPAASIGVSEPSIHQAQPATTDMVANTAMMTEVEKQA
jgi:lambda repressor-like predicted transcriptional regulator